MSLASLSLSLFLVAYKCTILLQMVGSAWQILIIFICRIVALITRICVLLAKHTVLIFLTPLVQRFSLMLEKVANMCNCTHNAQLWICYVRQALMQLRSVYIVNTIHILSDLVSALVIPNDMQLNNCIYENTFLLFARIISKQSQKYTSFIKFISFVVKIPCQWPHGFHSCILSVPYEWNNM